LIKLLTYFLPLTLILHPPLTEQQLNLFRSTFYGKMFFFLGSETHPASYSTGTGGTSRGVKAADTDHSSSPNAKVKNM
jgi:hypothetical protein